MDNFLVGQLNNGCGGSIDTTTIINEGPEFAAYMTVDDQGNPQGTNVIFFKNGGLILDSQNNVYIESFPNQQMFRLDNPFQKPQVTLSGKLPALPLGFITYPADATYSAAPEITLHRYASHSTIDTLKTYVVKQISINDGYNNQVKCYEYNNVSAAQDSTFTIVRFQEVTVYESCVTPDAQKYGYTKHYFHNGIPLTDSNSTTTPFSHSFDGLPIGKAQYDFKDNLVASTINNWVAVTQIATDPIGKSNRNIYGVINQVQFVTNIQEGLISTINCSYSLASGAVTQTTQSYYGSTGDLITEQKQTNFGYEIYPELWQRNLLTSVAQATILIKKGSDKNDFSIASRSIQTYKAWPQNDGRSYWAISEKWISTEATAPDFTNWSSGNPISQPQWLRTENIALRGQNAEVLKALDVNNLPVTYIYDDEGVFKIASFVGEMSEENGLSYDCFEQYQSSQWKWSQPSGSTIIDTDSFTGKCCLAITQSGTLSKVISVSDFNKSYVFSTWYKIDRPSSQKDNIILNLLIVDPVTNKQLQKSISSASDQWQYAQWVVDLSPLSSPQAKTLTLQVNLNIGQMNLVLKIDHLIFMPHVAKFNAKIFDKDLLMQTESLGQNGLVSRSFRNIFNEISAANGANENIIGFKIPFLSRQLGNNFDNKHPNSQLIIKGAKQGFFDEFKDNALNAYQFIDCAANDWQVKNRKLSIVTSNIAPLGARIRSNNFSSNSLAIRVVVDNQAIDNVIDLGTGAYAVAWNGKFWALYEINNGQPNIIQKNATVAFQKEWTLCVFDTRLIFLANGIEIFNYSSPNIAKNSHGLELGLQKLASFSNLLVADDISLSYSYLDGVNRPIQLVEMESADTAILHAKLYDERGHAAIQIKPSRIKSNTQSPNPFQYYDAYVTNSTFNSSLWQGAPLEGPAASVYHPTDKGYPFIRQINEPSPLGRILCVGKAGIEFAITPDGNSHITSYSYSLNNISGSFLYPLPENQYLIAHVTDADGNTQQTWTDSAGRQIGKICLSSSTDTVSQISSNVYDEFGRKAAVIPPNYYANKSNSSSNSSSEPVIPSCALTMSYNFLGEMIQITNPDAGQTRYIYTSASQPRFMQDAIGQDKNFIYYIKYDDLNRVVERGYYNMTWDQTLLESKVDADPSWPPSDNTWGSRHVYDGDDTTPLMVGRLWQALSNNDENGKDPDVIDIFEYNRLGKVVTHSRQFSTFNSAKIYKISHSYKDSGMLVSSSDSETGLTEFYCYNPLGQITTTSGITNDKQTVLMSYGYTQEGQIDSMDFLPSDDGKSLLKKTFTYNSQGWLLTSEDDIFSETLAYNTVTESGQQPYYNGTISAQDLQYKKGKPLIESHIVKVDYLNQITTLTSGKNTENWTFDDNGNLLTHISDTNKQMKFLYQNNQIQSFNDETTLTNDTYSYNYTKKGEVEAVSKNGSPLSQFFYSKKKGKTEYVTSNRSSGSNKVNFDYGSEGARTLKTVSIDDNVTSHSLLFESKTTLEIDSTSDNTVAKRIVHVPGTKIIFCNNTYSYVSMDHLNSTRSIMDQSGEIIGQYQYDAYGLPDVLSEPSYSFKWLYTGHYYDTEIKLYDCKARRYDPFIGRFYSPDSSNQFYSPYIYCANNPLMNIDPTGNFSWNAFAGGLIGGLEVLAGVALTVATGGAAASIGGGALIGAGVSGITYTASSGNNFSWSSWGIQEGIGGVGGALSGGAGYGAAALSASRGIALGATAGAISQSGSAVLGQLAANGIQHNNLSTGLWQSALIGGATGVVAGGLAARGRVTTFSETESMFGTRFNTGSGAVGDGRSVADNNCFFTSLAFVVGSDSDELAGQLGMQEGVVSVAQAGKAIRDLELGTGAPTIVNNAGDAYFNMTQVGGSDYEYLVGYEQNGNSVGHFINAIVDDGPVITFYDGQLGGQLRSLPLANRYTMFSISRTKIADVFGGITMMKP